MPLQKRQTGELLAFDIQKVLALDFQKVKASKEFEFDWQKEQEREAFKIFLLDEQENILGLISLLDYPAEERLHLNLIEVSISNRGKQKKIDHIAGCLLAFACKLAFKRGYIGFVSLMPKTEFIQLYQEKYGFQFYGHLMAVEQHSSNAIIEKYLPYENK